MFLEPNMPKKQFQFRALVKTPVAGQGFLQLKGTIEEGNYILRIGDQECIASTKEELIKEIKDQIHVEFLEKTVCDYCISDIRELPEKTKPEEIKPINTSKL